MKVTYCDCCGIKITEAEQRYSIEIMKGCDKEHILEDVCDDCYNRFKGIIDNARNGDMTLTVKSCILFKNFNKWRIKK